VEPSGSVVGPTLPTRALRQVGSYQGYTGRPANVVATAAHVTQTGPQGCCERGGALPHISYLSRHAPRMSSTIDSVTSNREIPLLQTERNRLMLSTSLRT
jgi:hypothetical protein